MPVRPDPAPRQAAPHPRRVHRPSGPVAVTRRVIPPLLAAMLVLWALSFPYLPLQDLPDWIYQGYLFHQFLFAGNPLGHYFILQPYVPPNAISTILIGILSTFLDPIVAGKVVVAAAMLLLFTGVSRYIRLLSGGWTMVAPLVAFLLVFNLNFWLGNVNFTFGLGVALLGFDLMMRRRWIESLAGAAGIFLLAYLSHFFAYAILLYAVTVYLIFDRRTVSFRRLLLVNVPSLILFAWFLSESMTGAAGSAAATGGEPFDLMREVKDRLFLFGGVILPFQRFKGLGDPGPIFTAVNYLFVALVAALSAVGLYMLARGTRTRRSRFPLILAAPLPIVILLLPLGAAGIVRPGERLVIFFVINVIAALLAEFPRHTRVAAWILAPLCLASLIYYTERTWEFNLRISKKRIPPHEERMALAGRGGTDGFLRISYYAAIREGRPLPIFTSGLFTYIGVDSPLDTTGRAR